MAVYTVLDEKAVVDILRFYELGEMQRFEAISSGIENTNYFIWLLAKEQRVSQWVLTIFENLDEEALPFFNRLTHYLSQQGFAVPAPRAMKDGKFIFSIDQFSQQNIRKFGVIVPKFEGSSIDFPDVRSCQKIAVATAKMHLALNRFSEHKTIQHTFAWCQQLANELHPLIPVDDQQVVTLALTRYQTYLPLIDQCPAGIVHGDLFRDNVLFDAGEITGIIDFYHAGRTAFLFDLAVIANDWAVNFECLPDLFSSNSNVIDMEHFSANTAKPRRIYDEQKLSALVEAYESVRPFTVLEKQVWPYLLELAAFRFYLSRLKTKYTQGYQQEVKAGDVVKSPEAMKLILLAAMQKSVT